MKRLSHEELRVVAEEYLSNPDVYDPDIFDQRYTAYMQQTLEMLAQQQTERAS